MPVLTVNAERPDIFEELTMAELGQLHHPFDHVR
jgi:hypothetical protein